MKKKNFGTKVLENILKKVKSMSVKEYKELSKNFVGDDNQDCCLGFGLWAIGDACPMDPRSVADGCPTIACPKCGANANPVKPVKTMKISKRKLKKAEKFSKTILNRKVSSQTMQEEITI